jgi:acetate kinase
VNILTLNSGSSSLKYGIYTVTENGCECAATWNEPTKPGSDAAAIAEGHAAAQVNASGVPIDAVGHRIVFGGEHDGPALLTKPLMERLSRLASCDPLHMPGALACISAAQKAFPSVPHVVCFDTAFFRDMPKIARLLPVPTDDDPDFRRYGFHGLSYEYLRTILGSELRSRCIFAHLGSGASLAALRNGHPVDTTMGFSAMSGLIMATRPGDIDPGVLLHLMESANLDVTTLRSVLEKRSGLAAISGGEGDVRALLVRRNDARARLAIDAFVQSVAKHIGALATVLGGIEQIVFTGGIGEHLPAIRSSVAQSLQHLGVELDEDENALGSEIISAAVSSVDVRVIPTDENMTIARRSYEVLT